MSRNRKRAHSKAPSPQETLGDRGRLSALFPMGSENPTEWGSTMIFSIINARYEAYMPTIVTSNCGADELVQRMTPRDATDRNAQKTVDRLREMCVAVQMDWPSWRSK